MKISAQNVVLSLAAVSCFVGAFAAPKRRDPAPALTAVMGILLLRRAIIGYSPAPVVIVAGCVLAGLAVRATHEDRNRKKWSLFELALREHVKPVFGGKFSKPIFHKSLQLQKLISSC
jgi:hypothetical protein